MKAFKKFDNSSFLEKLNEIVKYRFTAYLNQ